MDTVVIFAGGLGSRLSEETNSIPKPMVQIGGIPILLHIINKYRRHGFNDFIICAGYKSLVIKKYFQNFNLHNSDLIFHQNEYQLLKKDSDFKVRIVETGLHTQTGGRLARIKHLLNEKEYFLYTYGDGLSDVDLNKVLDFHKSHKKKVTITGVYPPARFGALELGKNGAVKKFIEKPTGDGGFINGGFGVINKEVLDMLNNDNQVFELDILEKLAIQNSVHAFIHKGFWLPMDTLRDKQKLEELSLSGNAPWMK